MKIGTDGIPPDTAYLSTNGGFAPPTHYELNLPKRFLGLNRSVQAPLPICIVEGGEELARQLAAKWLSQFSNPPPMYPETVHYL